VTTQRRRTFTVGLENLVAYKNGSNAVIIASQTTQNQVLRFVDDGTALSSFSVLTTAAANTAYRGIALALAPNN
jgi:hypothetical protein